MRDFNILFVHVIDIICRLWRPGGARSVIAESILIKQQLLILNRSLKRAPNLRVYDRFIAGVCSMFVKPSRIVSHLELVTTGKLLDSNIRETKVDPLVKTEIH
jgi:putative transposase